MSGQYQPSDYTQDCARAAQSRVYLRVRGRHLDVWECGGRRARHVRPWVCEASGRAFGRVGLRECEGFTPGDELEFGNQLFLDSRFLVDISTF